MAEWAQANKSANRRSGILSGSISAKGSTVPASHAGIESNGAAVRYAAAFHVSRCRLWATVNYHASGLCRHTADWPFRQRAFELRRDRVLGQSDIAITSRDEADQTRAGGTGGVFCCSPYLVVRQSRYTH